MSSTNQKPVVKKSEFIKLVETKTKAQVASHYGLTEKDVTKIAGQLKVTFKKRKEDNFIIEDDSESQVESTSVVEDTTPVEEPVNITNTEVPNVVF